MNFVKSFFKFLVRPHYWILSNTYDKEWDIELNHYMDTIMDPKFSEVNTIDGDIYYIIFNNKNVWIQNYPYAYGCDFPGRPSRNTILRLRKYTKMHMQKQFNLDEYRDGLLQKILK